MTGVDLNVSQTWVDEENSTAIFVPEVKGFQPFFGNSESAAQISTTAWNFNGGELKTIVLNKTQKFIQLKINLYTTTPTDQ